MRFIRAILDWLFGLEPVGRRLTAADMRKLDERETAKQRRARGTAQRFGGWAN